MISSAQQILTDTIHVAGAWLYWGFRGDLKSLQCKYNLSRPMSYWMFNVRMSSRMNELLCVERTMREPGQDRCLHKATEIGTFPVVETARVPGLLDSWYYMQQVLK